MDFVVEHWQGLTGGLGLMAALRGLYWLAVNIAAAPFERDLLKKQILALEARIATLERIISAMESSAPSSAGSSAVRATIPILNPKRRRLSNRSTH